ncbi:MAG: segregation/condensation protein A [Eubacteriaceae bacterium]|nr:segregation/condensation protein A [Eubacteriaceae bacterium]
MNYEIQLDEFQGPFDLLLHLINKNEIDIFDIPISSITSQYMEYINSMKDRNLEMTSEFILMASRLIEIKSKMLLPVEENDEGEEVDPREELAQKLYEYKIFKEISMYIKGKERLYLHTVFKDPEYIPDQTSAEISIDLDELLKAFRNIMAANDLLEGEDSSDVHMISREEVRIEDRIRHIRDILLDCETVRFHELFSDSSTTQKIVVTFLAILQLIKNNIITFQQDMNFDEIIIRRI